MESSLIQYGGFGKKNNVRIRMVMALLVSGALSLYGQTVDISILATTDVNNYYLDYDYFNDMPSESNGLVRIAAAVRAERELSFNVLLFDNGDLVQGSPFGEYLARNPPRRGQISPIMSFLNTLKYDAISLGDQDFSFGLPYLNTVISGAKFPVLSASLINPITRTPYFRPYSILLRNFRDSGGGFQLIRVGVLGLLPPQVLRWEQAALKGKVQTQDPYAAAGRYVAEMKDAGADIVVILAHSGLRDSPRRGGEEDFSAYLTEIPGVDAVVAGHRHKKFPTPSFEGFPNADVRRGTVNGVPLVMPGSYADTLGVINLTIRKEDGRWKRTTATGRLAPVYNAAGGRANFAVDLDMSSLLTEHHLAARNYIRAPLTADRGPRGECLLTDSLTSFFARLRDDYSVQIINEAQIRYAEQVLAGTEYAGLPILSAASPCKSGARPEAAGGPYHKDPYFYTHIPPGPLSIKNVGDLYFFPRRLVILKLKGSDLKEWLEMSAGQFNHLEGRSEDERLIVNEDFPGDLFDVIDGLSYKIDPSGPAKYSNDGSLINPDAERIRDLRFAGRPLDREGEFILVTHTARVAAGYPGVNPGNVVLECPVENRLVLERYIIEKREISPRPDNNWSLVLPQNAGPLLFRTSPEAQENPPPGLSYLRTDEDGFAVYRLSD